jgi:predicted MFS family arabinose efflux permease
MKATGNKHGLTSLAAKTIHSIYLSRVLLPAPAVNSSSAMPGVSCGFRTRRVPRNVAYRAGPFYIVLAGNRFDLDAGTVGAYLLAQIGGMIVGSFAWSKLLNRTRFKIILRFAIPLLACVPLYALTAAYLLPSWAFVGVFILGGVSTSGMLIGIDGAFLEITTESNRVLFSGIRGTFNIVVALFPLVVGAVVTSLGYPLVFILSSAAVLVAVLLVGRLVCPSDPK